MLSEKSLYTRLLHFKEAVVIALVGGVPLPVGNILRRMLYRTILGQIGSSVHIAIGVEFVNADLIELGNGVKIDRDVRIRNVGRNSQICIGDGTRISRGVDLKVHSVDGGKIEIGERTIVGPYSCMSGRSIKIGNYCLIAPHVGIFANNHNFADPKRKIKEQGHSYKGIVIEDDCWLGSGVKVIDGVTIGQGSVIGAGAVVTKDIPPYSIAVGVPAKVVSQRKASDSLEDAEAYLATQATWTQEESLSQSTVPL